ncbi:uncharacterized protein TNCV_1091661 [Trichonephila clavipes]|nr:uncharacterized protein TNCV_1091661 [Trichonephila clavipes]
MNRVDLTEYNGDQMSRKMVKRKGYKRSRESGWSEPERKIRKGSISKWNKRNLSSNDSNVLPICSKKRRTQDKVAVKTNQYNLRPRNGKEVESDQP